MVADRAKQERYIKDYFVREGVKLDPSKIRKNPGLRSLAKLMLNSFWGKFTQRSNLYKIQAVAEPYDLYTLLNADEKQVHSIRVVNDEMLEIVYNFIDEADPVQVNTNIFIGCFTTCWARLKLYEALDSLNPEQVLYKVTDSIIYS